MLHYHYCDCRLCKKQVARVPSRQWSLDIERCACGPGLVRMPAGLMTWVGVRQHVIITLSYPVYTTPTPKHPPRPPPTPSDDYCDGPSNDRPSSITTVRVWWGRPQV
eukprot:scaffold12735_cov32-Tisochrysis_lutea.AAC.3